MASLSFYIDKNSKSPFKRLMYCLSHKGKQHRASLKLKIHESDWDSKKNFLKATARNSHHITLRKKLVEMQNYVNVEALIENPGVTFEQLKYKFAERVGRSAQASPEGPTTLHEAVYAYGDRSKKQGCGEGTYLGLRRLGDLLKLFFEETKTSPDIRSYTEAQKKVFLDNLVHWMIYVEVKNRFGEVIKKKFSNATVSKHLTNIKTAATYYEIPITINIKRIFPRKVFAVGEGEALFFKTEEILFLYNYQPEKEWQKEILDMLVFCAFTGLRHGEMKYVTKDRIIEWTNISGENYTVLQRYSSKENNTNIVPLNKICVGILKKYWNREGDMILPFKTNVFCNKELHPMLRDADPMFHETATVVEYVGTEAVSKEVPRWKALTFHATRHHYSHLLRKVGLGIDDTAVLLNHKTADTTRRVYRHDSIKQIVEQAYDKINDIEALRKVI